MSRSRGFARESSLRVRSNRETCRETDNVAVFSRVVKHRWRLVKMETGRTRLSCLRRMSVIAQR